MTPVTLAEVFAELRNRLDRVEAVLLQVTTDTRSERVRLLCTELLDQHRALLATIGRIQDRQGASTLARPVSDGPVLGELTPFLEYWDSRAVTAWVLTAISVCTEALDVILTRRRLGRAKAALDELHKLLAAHGRRVAVEAQRFEDL